MGNSDIAYSEKEEEYVVEKINKFYEYGGDLEAGVNFTYDETKDLNIHLFKKLNFLDMEKDRLS